MPYRARANGNVVDTVPASLVGVLYDEIPEGADAPSGTRRVQEPKKPRRPRAPRKPKADK